MARGFGPSAWRDQVRRPPPSPRAGRENAQSLLVRALFQRGIVAEHDGWIGVESEVGAGSELAVFLPAEEETG